MADPFAELDDAMAAKAQTGAVAGSAMADPFAADDDRMARGESPPPPPQQTSALGAVASHAAAEAVPATGVLAGAGAGAALGLAIGPEGTIPGALIGGGLALAGGLAGGMLAGKAQDTALEALPDTWKDPLKQELETTEKEHPYMSMLGGLVPYIATMTPFSAPKAGPVAATALGRLLSNPTTARVFGGTLQGGIELSQEYRSGQTPDWAKVAIATGFGLVFNRPNSIGEAIERAPRRLFEYGPRSPTLANVDAANVAGPGVTEEVATGELKRNEAAEQTAQDAARTEASILGPPPEPDLHAAVERMNPEAVVARDHFEATAKTLREAEVPNPALIAETQQALRGARGEVGDAYARAAESKGVEPELPAQRAEGPIATEGERQAIATDVSRQLVAAGRPADEAEAHGQLIAERYAARAATLGISAPDLYEQDRTRYAGEAEAAAPAVLAGPATIRTPPTEANPEGGETLAPGALIGETGPSLQYAQAAKAHADKLGLTNLIRILGSQGANPKEIEDVVGKKITAPEIEAVLMQTKQEPGPQLEQRREIPEVQQPEVPTAVDDKASYEGAGALARGQTWSTGRDLKLAMQNAVQGAARAAGVDLEVNSPQTRDYITRVGVRDALEALKTNANAVGWYDRKTRQALAVLATMHPEIATDPNARFAATYALAATSNGLKVAKNFELMETAYRHYKETGRMPENIGIGTSKGSIDNAMKQFNRLQDEWGPEAFRKFMLTDFPAGDIAAINPNLKPAGEWADQMVRGASILGPKIGNGFFSNLNGKFDALTMDRWLMRTWGRWTGTLIEQNPELIGQARGNVSTALAGLTPEDRARIGVQGTDPDAVAKAVAKASQDSAARAQMSETPTGDTLRRTGNRLAGYLDGQKEMPSGPGERVQIRAAFQQILSRLREDPRYHDMTMADLQAVLWYGEKRLYESAKEDSIEGEEGKGYNDDEAPDYANAAAQLARDNGVPEKRIAAAIKQEEPNGRADTARREPTGLGQPETGTGQQGAAGGFTESEKRSFRRAAGLRSARVGRSDSTGDEAPSWSYTGKSGQDGGGVRLLKSAGVRYIREWKPGANLRRVLARNGSVAPDLVEVAPHDAESAQKFADAITASKAAGQFGASVYVYPASDYANARLFLTKDGKSGFAVKHDGDIVSVFSGTKGDSAGLLEAAIAAGGRKLDAFDTVLPDLYHQHGFVEASRLKWDESQAPEGWDKQTFGEFNGGEPDVVFMVHDPGDFSPTLRKARAAADYDKAVASQDRAAAKIAGTHPIVQAVLASLDQARNVLKARFSLKAGEVHGLIQIFRQGDASSLIEEAGHDFIHQMDRDVLHPNASYRLKLDYAMTLRWLGVTRDQLFQTKPNGRYTRRAVQAHEQFAAGVQQYVWEGRAPSPRLAGVFEQFKGWLRGIYSTISSIPYLKEGINDDVRGVMGRLLAAPEPRPAIITPEQPARPTFSDIHAVDAAEATGGAQADAIGDRIIAESEQREKEHVPAQQAIEAVQRTEAANNAGEVQKRPDEEGFLEEGGGRSGPDGKLGGGGDGSGEELRRGGAGVSEGAATPAAARPVSRQPAGTAAIPHPEPPNVFPRGDPRDIDRAGNINLDRIGAPDDVKRVIRDAAEANDNFIGDRQGKVEWEDTVQIARDLGMTPTRLLQRNLGQAFNASEIWAARQLLVQSAYDVHAKMKVGATGDDAAVLEYVKARERHKLIQAQIAGITAEAGRALNIMKKTSGEGMDVVGAVDKIIRDGAGITLDQARKEAKLGAALKTPQQISEFMDSTRRPGWGKFIEEYWMNNLLSGPTTHITYSIANELLALQRNVPETGLAAVIGGVRAAMGREGTRVRMAEVPANLRMMFGAGAKAGAQAAVAGFKAGATVRLPGEGTGPDFAGGKFAEAPRLDPNAFGVLNGIPRGFQTGNALLDASGQPGAPRWGAVYSQQRAIPDIKTPIGTLPVGTVLTLPSRTIAAMHSFFRVQTELTSLNAWAVRTAREEHEAGSLNQMSARIDYLRNHPTEEALQAAKDEANVGALMGPAGAFTGRLQQLVNTPISFPHPIGDVRLFRFIDPFVNISSNILKEGLLKRTPLAILSPTIRADLMGKNGNIAADMAAARMVAGTTMAVASVWLAHQGMVNGSGPTDHKIANVWKQAGNLPHSVRIGDMWYAMNRLGPLGLLMGVAADLHDVAHLASEGEYVQAGSMLQHAFTQNILDESFLRGPSDLMAAIQNPATDGERWVMNMGTSFLPFSVGMAQMARSADPYSREARTFTDAVKAKTLGLSESLWPRVSIWGQPMPSYDAAIHSGITAIYKTQVNPDPVDAALLKLGIGVAPPKPVIQGVRLTDQQYHDYATLTGHMRKQRLDALVGSQVFRRSPGSVQHDLIKSTIDQSKTAAQGWLFARYPSILRDAHQTKMDILHKEDEE